MAIKNEEMDTKPLAEEIEEMTLKEEEFAHNVTKGPLGRERGVRHQDTEQESKQNGHRLTKSASHSGVSTPRKADSAADTPTSKAEFEEIVGGDITLKHEPGKAPRLARTSSKKIMSRPPPLFLESPDATEDCSKTFHVIEACTYANKYLGTTDHALECDCSEEWDAKSQRNHACGEDSDCINRATKMECVGDCNCGTGCQNQRFQSRQYADVSVINTEKKGYGLRANADLQANAFIFEYIGEVIGEATFRRRIVQYDDEGVKHFYFMSLNKGEFIDATKSGNLGRFCNHSCNPNCYVDKWVVGNKLRMGIFAERNITAGEELVFNYNVDRYGANPQPCYCGETNCTGFIGGKTQTERATKLSLATIEALGIEDADDWDTAVAKKGRKKKVGGEDDEEYVESMQPKGLDENGVTKVMATLMQCKEKWIAVKLLSRIQLCEEDRVLNRVVRMHGYQILNTVLTTFIEDANVVLQIFGVLFKLPRLTRNKIQDSKIEGTIEKLQENPHEDVKAQAISLLKIWTSLEVAYRIPRVKRDPAAIAAAEKADREERRRLARDRSRSRSRSRSVSPIKAPTGPKSNLPRSLPPRPAFRRPPFAGALPAGWFAAQSNGKTYYYSSNGQTTWERPTAPVVQPPPPPREKTNEQKLQDIINSITTQTSTTPLEKSRDGSASTPIADGPSHDKSERKEKWRSYDEEKQKKLYENTLFPHIQYVMNKYKGKLPKDDLKRFAKEVAKKIVASDFKNKRVTDPTRIDTKQERTVKKFVKEWFDKAVAKKVEHDRRKEAGRKAKNSLAPDGKVKPTAIVNGDSTLTPPATGSSFAEDVVGGERVDQEDVVLSDNEVEDEENDEESPGTGTDRLKRKRDTIATPDNGDTPRESEDAATPVKRIRGDTEEESQDATPPPPPPPPPPPAEDSPPVDGNDMADNGIQFVQTEEQQNDEAKTNGHQDFEQEPLQDSKDSFGDREGWRSSQDLTVR